MLDKWETSHELRQMGQCSQTYLFIIIKAVKSEKTVSYAMKNA